MAAVSYDAARAALAERLSDKALRHSEGVAAMAAELARRYGVDVETARLAGLLHDWAREDSRDALVERARELDIPVTEVDVARPYLLHARIGAVGVRDAFSDLTPEIVRAIELHTTGNLEMTDLDRIVYLADMMEEGRDYPGAAELRAYAEEGGSLPDLFKRGYALSIEHVVGKGHPLHPVTVLVWNSLLADERVGGESS